MHSPLPQRHRTDATAEVTLADALQRTPIAEDAAADLLRSLLASVAHLHGCGVMHRNIKAEHVLLSGCPVGPRDDTWRTPVLVGFAFATRDTSSSDVCGTPFYMAPEVIAAAGDDSVSYDKACDVWSFGVLAYMVLQQGAKPFTGASIEECFEATCSNQPPWPRAVSDTARAFVELLLTTDSDERPTAAEALCHPWLVPALLPDVTSSGSCDGLGGFTARPSDGSDVLSSLRGSALLPTWRGDDDDNDDNGGDIASCSFSDVTDQSDRDSIEDDDAVAHMAACRTLVAA